MCGLKHLLKLMDLSEQEINDILNLADQLKYEKKNGIKHHILEGKTLGLIFSKASTRTRVSFEVGMYDLGGSALFLSARDLQIGRGEPVEDTARVLSRYLDGIMISTFAQSEVEDLAKYGSIPVVNGLVFLKTPMASLMEEGETGMTFSQLFRNKTFWWLLIMMICSGASEHSVAEWASAFAERGLGIPKTVGDLAGPLSFAVCMGISRVIYGNYGDVLREFCKYIPEIEFDDINN